MSASHSVDDFDYGDGDVSLASRDRAGDRKSGAHPMLLTPPPPNAHARRHRKHRHRDHRDRRSDQPRRRQHDDRPSLQQLPNAQPLPETANDEVRPFDALDERDERGERGEGDVDDELRIDGDDGLDARAIQRAAAAMQRRLAKEQRERGIDAAPDG